MSKWTAPSVSRRSGLLVSRVRVNARASSTHMRGSKIINDKRVYRKQRIVTELSLLYENMIPVAVNCLLIDPTLNTDSNITGTYSSTSASPYACA
jgi:hypothetical protein